MRIFYRGDKVNFVDDNNMLVGYDLSQDCCEHADWFIADHLSTELQASPQIDGHLDMPGWNFDPEFFQEVASDELDAGNMVCFRLVNGAQEQYLHLYNSHNGYYGHGFTVEIGGKETTNAYL